MALKRERQRVGVSLPVLDYASCSSARPLTTRAPLLYSTLECFVSVGLLVYLQLDPVVIFWLDIKTWCIFSLHHSSPGRDGPSACRYCTAELKVTHIRREHSVIRSASVPVLIIGEMFRGYSYAPDTAVVREGPCTLLVRVAEGATPRCGGVLAPPVCPVSFLARLSSKLENTRGKTSLMV